MNRSVLLRSLAVAGGLTVVSCVQDSTGPHAARLAHLAVAPLFDERALMLVDFDRVRIVLLRPNTNQIALDTVVLFPAGADSIVLSLPVAITGASETFSLSMAMISPAGDTVFRGGPVNVVAASGVIGTSPAQPTIRYTGTGSNAASVRFVTAPAEVFFGDTVTYTAEALDSAGAVIANTPIVFTTSDTSRAKVPVPSVGRVVARNVRGRVDVIASLLTPPSASTPLTVQPRPSVLALGAGSSGQAGTVGAALAQPITAVVTAADGLGVKGVTVGFAVASGGGTLSAASAVTDTAGRASVTWTMGTTSGSQSATATATGLTPPSVTFTATAAPGPARSLTFTQAPPVSVTAGAPFGVTLAARDTFGNAATAFTGTVSLAFGANPGGGVLSGTTSVAAVAGVATFTGLSVNVATAGYTLVASSTGIPNVISSTMTVTAGAPSRLSFATPPSDVVAGVAIAPAVVVSIRDASGNVVPTATDSVAIGIAVGPTGATLGGTTKVAAVAGRATFADLRLVKAGTYSLVPSSGSMTRDTSATFTVSPASASVLAFTQGPTSALAGAAISPAVQVTVRDSLGNTVTGYADTVALALTENPGADTLRGTTRVVAVAGVATFADLSLQRAASGYRLTAIGSGVGGEAASTPFDIAPDAAAKLKFGVQPSQVNVGAAIAPAVTVTARDAYGNLVPTFTGGVTAALGANPGGATLGGTATVSAVGGTATFADLQLDLPGVGYTLVATATGLGPDTSAAFEARSVTPTQLAFLVQPTSATAGAAIAPAVQVALKDAFGNVVTTATDTVTIALGANPGGHPLLGTVKAAAVNGVASFANLLQNRAASGYTLVASSGSLPSDTSDAFDVAPAAAFAVNFTTQPPATATAGVPMTLVVAAMDQFGNTVTSFTGTITLGIDVPPDYDTLQGTVAVAAVNGVATFTTPYLRKASDNYMLRADAPSLARGNSNPFVVVPGPVATLAFSPMPGLTQTAGSPIPMTIMSKDAYGNPATNFTGAVTLSLATTPGDTLSGTLTRNAVAGVTTFDDVSIDEAGLGYTIRATTGSVFVDCVTFEVVAGVARTIGSTAGGAQTGTVGTALGQPFVVTVADSVGNPVSGAGVVFRATAGGGTLGGADSVVVTTNVAGQAGATLTLGVLVGTNTVAASAAGLAGSPVTFSATGVAGSAATLFLSGLANDTAGASQTLAVEARDANGNRATGYAGTVAFTSSDPQAVLPASYTFSGPDAGLRAFAGVVLKSAGSQTVTATDVGTPSVTGSQTVAVGVGTATQIAAHDGSGQTVPVGTPVAVAPAVVVRDGQGNPVSGVSVTFGVATGGGTITPTSPVTVVTDASGVAVLAGTWTLGTTAGSNTLAVTSGGLAGSPVTITATGVAGPASTAVLTGLGAAVAGTGQTLSVELRDASGNRATGYTGTVHFTSTDGQAVLPADYAFVAGDAGLRSFTGVTLKTAGSQTVTVTDVGTPAITASQMAAVTAAAAAQVVYTTQPPSTQVVGSPFALVAEVRDAYGNRVSTSSDAVSLVIGANPAAGTLSGTVTVSAVAGVASFSGLSIDNIGSPYTLVASASGMASGTSNGFQITAAAGVNAWVNPSGGSWSSAANWSKGTVPASTEAIEIRQSGTYTVTLDAAATIGNTLTVGGTFGTQTLAIAGQTLTVNGQADFTARGALDLSGGTLTGTGPVNVGGAMSWTGGTISGAHQVSVLAGATLGISGSATPTLVSQAVLELGGTGTWSGTNTLQTGNGSVFRVASGATLDVTGDVTLTNNQGTSPSVARVVNLGTINRTTSAGTAYVNAPLDNSGVVNVTTGTLNLGNAGYTGTSSGTFVVSSGAVLQVSNGTSDLTGTASIGGAGTFVASGSGTTTVAGELTVDSVSVAGGTLNYTNTGGSASVANMAVSSGTLGGAGVVVATETFGWSGGYLATGSGTGKTQVTGIATINGATNRFLVSQYTLELAGTSPHTWAGTHTIQTGNGSVFRVASGATLNVTGDVTLTNNQGTSPSVSRVVNLGTINRTTSTGTAYLNAPFDNDGTVNVTTGTLNLGNAGVTATSNGAYAVSAGAVLQVSGGTSDLTGTASIGGAGTFLASGGTTNVGGPLTVDSVSVAGGTLRYNNTGGSASVAHAAVTSGTLGGVGVLQATETFGWSGGSLATGSGTGKTQVTGVATISGATNRFLVSQYTLELAGTSPHTWAGTHTIQAGNGSVFRVASGATLNVTGDVTLTNNQGTSPSVSRVVNLGTINRTTSAGTAYLNAPLDNDGTMNVATGTLNLGNAGYTGTSSGTFVVSSGAVLQVSNGTSDLTGTASIGGAGTLLASGGTTTVAGALTVDSVSVAGGTLTYTNTGTPATVANVTISGGTFGGSGAVTTSGSAAWLGGTLSGSGSLTVVTGGVLNITGASGKTLTAFYRLENAGTGYWRAGNTISTGQGAVISNALGGTLYLKSDAGITHNQGGVLAEFRNLGTLVRDSSAGTFTFDVNAAPANMSGPVQVNTGTLSFTRGGELQGATTLADGAVLDLSPGVSPITLRPGFVPTGLGTLRISGGTVTADSGSTLTLSRLAMTGGSFTHKANVTVSDSLGWTGGSLNAATSAGTGTTTVASTGRLYVSGAAGKGLMNQTLRIESLDAVIDSTGQLQMSVGSNLVIASTGRLDLRGTGGFTLVTGSPTASVNNQGQIYRSSRTSSFNIAVPMTSSNEIRTVDGPITLTGGGTLSGTANTLDGGALVLGGGAWSLSNNFTVTGSLSVSAGSLALATKTLNVSGTFSTTGTGVLQMTNAADLLVGQHVNFSGGNTSGSLTNGIIRMTGDFTQAGSTATAFAPSGIHVVEFNSSTLQNVTFQNPGASSSRFQAMRVVGQVGFGRDSVELLSDVYVADTVAVRNRSVVHSFSPQRIVVGKNVWMGMLDGPAMRAFVLEVGDTLGDTTLYVLPDTLVYNRTGTYVINKAPGQNLRVASGAASLGGGATNLPGNLEVSGTAILRPGGVRTAGQLQTTGTGKLRMLAGDTLIVLGSASFGGGSTTGELTDGLLRVAGNFSQTGATSTAFAPSGTHQVLMNGPAEQTVSFQSAASAFNSLDVRKPDGTSFERRLRLLSDVVVNGGLTVGRYSQIVSDTAGTNSQRLKVMGSVRVRSDTGSVPHVRPRVLELQSALDIDSIYADVFMPDTTVFFGNGGYPLPLGTPIRYQSVRVSTSSPMTWSCYVSCDSLQSDLVIGGLPSVASTFNAGTGGQMVIHGNLRTEGNGVFAMSEAVSVFVTGDASFAGGSTYGLLSGGTLWVKGSFRQAGSASAFSPNGTHVTVLNGAGNDVINFANPGYGSTLSHFWDLSVQDTINATTLETDVYAEYRVRTPYSMPGHTLTSSNRAVYANGMDMSYVTFDNTRLVVANGTPSWFAMYGSTFQNMSPSVDQFTAARSTGSAGFYSMQFLTPVTTGRYVVFDGLGGTPVLSIYSNLGTSPPTSSYSKLSGADILWFAPY